MSSFAMTVEAKLLHENSFCPEGVEPEIVHRSDICRLHMNILKVYGSCAAPALIEMTAMSAMRGPRAPFERWGQGTVIYIGSAKFPPNHPIKENGCFMSALLHLPYPISPSSDVIVENYWRLLIQLQQNYFGDDNVLTMHEKLYFVRKGWTNYGEFTSQWEIMERSPIRSHTGQQMDNAIKRVRKILWCNTFSNNLVKLTGKMDTLFESVAELVRGLPQRDLLLPLIFRWMSIRHEIIRQCEAFETISNRNFERCFPRGLDQE